MSPRVRITQIACEDEIIATLFDGTLSDVQKPSLIPPPTFLEPFSNIRRNGYTCPSHLAAQPVYFMGREFGRDLVEPQDELMRFLPDEQVLKRFRLRSHDAPSTWREFVTKLLIPHVSNSQTDECPSVPTKSPEKIILEFL